MEINGENLSAVLASIGDHVSMMDRDLNIIWANATAKRMFGDDLLGRKCYEVYHGRKTPCEPYPCITLRAFADGKTHQHETVVVDKNSNRLNFHCTASVALRDEGGVPLAVIEVSKDLTQTKKLETRMRQAQKMDAVKTLVEGIAHDFNNMLGIIVGNTELALSSLEKVPEWTPLGAWLDEIKTASMRAKGIVNRVLTCADLEEEKNEPIHILPVVEASLNRVRVMIPPSIEIKPDISISHDKVLTAPAQIHQILMHLCANAGQAMGDKGGVLEVRLENVKIEESSVEEAPGLSPGRYVRFMVADTGPGMTPEVVEHIFEPYYTTHPSRSGLGLWVVYGIVKAIGGEISVASDPGRGTRFMVWLPVSEDRAQPRKTAHLAKGTERILFVDDEPSLVQLGKQTLESLGYHTEACVSPLEALERFKADPNRFDLVITDMSMPDMTGDMLAAEILKIRPNMPVIMTSGYTRLVEKAVTGKEGLRAFLAKPIQMADLAQTIRKVLNG